MQKTSILWSIRGELLRKRLHRETNDRTTVLYGGTVKKMYRMNGFRPREAFLSGLVMNVCACVVTYNLICVKFKDNIDGSLSLYNLAIAFYNRKW